MSLRVLLGVDDDGGGGDDDDDTDDGEAGVMWMLSNW